MSVVYWAVLWTLLLPLTVGAHNERRARRPPRLQSLLVGSTSARPLFGVYRRAPNPAGGRAVGGTACTASAGSLLVCLTVCHTQRKKADARAPANGRALAFVDDKLKHVHSPPPASSLYTRHYWPHVYHACVPCYDIWEFRGIFRAFFPSHC
jgi:hypothetical protein